MAVFYWVLLELSRVFLANVSRTMCNLAFVFFIVNILLVIITEERETIFYTLKKMTSATVLWLSICLGNIVLARLILNLIHSQHKHLKNKNEDIQNAIKTCSFFLENAFSFVDVLDSKMIGLSVFLISNVFTGLVNLSMRTRIIADVFALLILFLNSFVSTLIPFVFYFYCFLKNKTLR